MRSLLKIPGAHCAPIIPNMFAYKKSIPFLGLIKIEALSLFFAVLVLVSIELFAGRGVTIVDRDEIIFFVFYSSHIFPIFYFLRKIIDFKKVLSEWNQNVKSDLLSAFKWFSIICGTALGVVVLFLLVLFILTTTNIVPVEGLNAFFDASESQHEENYLTTVLLYSPLRFILFLFSTCVLAPIIEEIIFRRLLYVTLRQKMKFIPALFISSIIFGTCHLSRNGIQAALLGLFLGFIYEKEQRLSIPIFTHVFWNFFATLVKIFI